MFEPYFFAYIHNYNYKSSIKKFIHKSFIYSKGNVHYRTGHEGTKRK